MCWNFVTTMVRAERLLYLNFPVVAVENGRLAKEELMKEEANYDLVLLDLMMPEMVKKFLTQTRSF